MLVELIKRERDVVRIMDSVSANAHASGDGVNEALHRQHALQALEVMINDGWVEASHDPKRPRLVLDTPFEGSRFHTNEPLNRRIAEHEAT